MGRMRIIWEMTTRISDLLIEFLGWVGLFRYSFVPCGARHWEKTIAGTNEELR